MGFDRVERSGSKIGSEPDAINNLPQRSPRKRFSAPDGLIFAVKRVKSLGEVRADKTRCAKNRNHVGYSFAVRGR